MNRGKLYLIPCPISEDGNHSITPHCINVVSSTRYFVVEKIKTARRFFKSVNRQIVIDDLFFFELNETNDTKELHAFLAIMKDGLDVGVVSEAGCPAIADPGHLAVMYAHQNGYEVMPLAGPSSILMALISSGFNGQRFTFYGYLPIPKTELISTLKQMEIEVKQTGTTQIFMETPYRNSSVLKECIHSLQPSTRLCVACDLDAPTQIIKTMNLSAWKKFDAQSLHKRPCIFLIG